MSNGSKKILMAAAGAGGTPSYPGTTVSITPTFGGASSINLDSAPLNIGTTGAYTITMLSGDMLVDIKMWGGGGASGWWYNQPGLPNYYSGAGGGGGAAVGRLVLNYGTNYVLQIADGGDLKTSGGPTGAATYQGGGIGSSYGSEGGGYSGIFEGSVAHGNAILMAGGGGGGGMCGYDGSTCGTGGLGAGAGGGTNGQNAGAAGGQAGSGGTQSAGGAGSPYNYATAGSALTGGVAQSAVAVGSMGGGGGGYYGGGGGNVGGGGGGSGYYDSSNSNLTNVTLYTGSGKTPGNDSDSDRGGSGDGAYNWGNGDQGRILLTRVP